MTSGSAHVRYYRHFPHNVNMRIAQHFIMLLMWSKTCQGRYRLRRGRRPHSIADGVSLFLAADRPDGCSAWQVPVNVGWHVRPPART